MKHNKLTRMVFIYIVLTEYGRIYQHAKMIYGSDFI